MRKNPNYRTDDEFNDYLNSIGGLINGHNKSIMTNRKEFRIGNGWLGLLEGLFSTLIRLGWKREVLTIKEKFGGLSIMLSDIPDNSLYFIAEVEKESHTICEVCGELGEKQKINSWVYTLCPEHSASDTHIIHNGKRFVLMMLDPILKGDYYLDALTNEVKICNVDNHFDPWTTKLVCLN